MNPLIPTYSTSPHPTALHNQVLGMHYPATNSASPPQTGSAPSSGTMSIDTACAMVRAAIEGIPEALRDHAYVAKQARNLVEELQAQVDRRFVTLLWTCTNTLLHPDHKLESVTTMRRIAQPPQQNQQARQQYPPPLPNQQAQRQQPQKPPQYQPQRNPRIGRAGRPQRAVRGTALGMRWTCGRCTKLNPVTATRCMECQQQRSELQAAQPQQMAPRQQDPMQTQNTLGLDGEAQQFVREREQQHMKSWLQTSTNRLTQRFTELQQEGRDHLQDDQWKELKKQQEYRRAQLKLMEKPYADRPRVHQIRVPANERPRSAHFHHMYPGEKFSGQHREPYQARPQEEGWGLMDHHKAHAMALADLWKERYEGSERDWGLQPCYINLTGDGRNWNWGMEPIHTQDKMQKPWGSSMDKVNELLKPLGGLYGEFAGENPGDSTTGTNILGNVPKVICIEDGRVVDISECTYIHTEGGRLLLEEQCYVCGNLAHWKRDCLYGTTVGPEHALTRDIKGQLLAIHSDTNGKPVSAWRNSKPKGLEHSRQARDHRQQQAAASGGPRRPMDFRTYLAATDGDDPWQAYVGPRRAARPIWEY